MLLRMNSGRTRRLTCDSRRFRRRISADNRARSSGFRRDCNRRFDDRVVMRPAFVVDSFRLHSDGLKWFVFFRLQFRCILLQIFRDRALNHLVGCVGLRGVGVCRIRFQRPTRFFPISASSLGRRFGFACNARKKRAELITRRLASKVSTTERDPDSASPSSDSSSHRRILRQRRQQSRPQIPQRNEISQHLGTRLGIGSRRHAGLFIPTRPASSAPARQTICYAAPDGPESQSSPPAAPRETRATPIASGSTEPRIADQFKHSGHYSSPRICRVFSLRTSS